MLKRIKLIAWVLLGLAAGLILLHYATPIAEGFMYPIGDPQDASPYRLTQDFGSSTFRGRPHTGQDWAPPTAGERGHQVKASAHGLVCYTGPLGGWGNLVILRHRWQGQVYYTFYAHLEEIEVRLGHRVNQGEKLGTMGTTGNSTGIHLHFAIRNRFVPGRGYTENLKGYFHPGEFIQGN